MPVASYFPPEHDRAPPVPASPTASRRRPSSTSPLLVRSTSDHLPSLVTWSDENEPENDPDYDDHRNAAATTTKARRSSMLDDQVVKRLSQRAREAERRAQWEGTKLLNLEPPSTPPRVADAAAAAAARQRQTSSPSLYETPPNSSTATKSPGRTPRSPRSRESSRRGGGSIRSNFSTSSSASNLSAVSEFLAEEEPPSPSSSSRPASRVRSDHARSSIRPSSSSSRIDGSIFPTSPSRPTSAFSMASPRSSFDSPSSSEEEEEEDEPISTTFSGPRIVRPVTLENDQFVQVLNREKDKVLEQRRRQQQQLDESKRSRDRSAEQDSGTDHSRTESGNSDASFASMTAVGPSPADEATLPPAFGGGSVGMERDDTLRPSSSSTGNRWDQGPTGGTVKSIDEIINGYKALGVVVGGNEVKGIVERRRSSVATIQLQQQQQRRPSDSMTPAPKPASRDVSLDEYQFPTFHAPNGSAEQHAQNLLPYVPFPTPPPSASLSMSTAGLDGPAGGKIKTIEEIIAQHAGATYDPIRKKNVATASSPITATFGDPISQHVQRTRELSNISSADSQDSLNREVRESIHSTLLEDRRRRRETSVASSVNGGFDDRMSVPGGGTTSSMQSISLKNYRGANSPSPSPRSISPNPQSVNIPSPTSTGHETQEQLELSLLLRSPRLTRLVKLSRPHNAHLTVSIADVGSPSGHPVVVFLGLGSVRYMLALYDELAEVFGLRLICVDRWGVGKTTNEPDITKRGFREWSRVVKEVVEDHLGLPRGRFSILAHSAGCPFAVETALATRVTGAIHLLAPWVVGVAGASADELGGGVSADSLAGMYKYLKYVPSGVLKTAQAAEWKIQGWRLGKAPPTVVVERDDAMFNVAETAGDHEDDDDFRKDASVDGSVLSKAAKRESLASLGIVGSGDVVDKLERMYPDGGIRLAGPHATSSTRSTHAAASTPRRKGSLSVNGKSLFGSILGGSAKSNRSYSGDASPSSVRSTGRRSSYFAASQIHDSPASSARERSSGLTAPATPTSASSKRTSYLSDRSFPPRSPTDSHSSLDHPSSPSASSIPPRGSHLTATPTRPSISPAVLISGLLRASHAESLPGSTLDLLVLLDRSSNSAAKTIDYRAVERPVRVWFGDKDDRISENSVRSLEREMKQCRVEVVPGADHNLMTNHQVMFRVLESISKEAALP